MILAIVCAMCIGLLHVIVSFLLVLFVCLSVRLCTLLYYLVNKDVYNTCVHRPVFTSIVSRHP